MNKLMPPIECVLFDAMHTLIYPDPPIFATYQAAALRQGVDLEPATVGRRFSQAFRAEEEGDRLRDLSTSPAREVKRWRDLVAATLPELPDSERGFQELWDHFGRPDSWRCYSDVGILLDELDQRRIPWAIASNFDDRLRDVAAGLPPLAGRIRAAQFAISSEIGWKKPHPKFFRAAIDRLGLAAERVVLIGDDPINDVQGAIQAGMQAVLLEREPGRARTDVQVPVVRGLAEIVPLLEW